MTRTDGRPRGCDLFWCPFASGALSLDTNGTVKIDSARLSVDYAVGCSACAGYMEQAASSTVGVERPARHAPRRTLSRTMRLVAGVFLMTLITTAAVTFRLSYGVTPIASITGGGRTFSGKTVTVVGDAKRVIKTPFSFAVYKLIDKTGEIYVTSRVLPPLDGERVRITGTVHAAPALFGLLTARPVITETYRGTPFLH